MSKKLEQSEIKPGKTLWHEINHEKVQYFPHPSLVLEVNEKSFKIKHLDGSEKEENISFDDSKNLSCMRICTKMEVLLFFSKEDERFNKMELEKKHELENLQNEHWEFHKKSDEFKFGLESIPV